MSNTKIYLVHYQVDWHNSDAEHETFAFVDKNKAGLKIAALIEKVERWNKRKGKEIVYRRNGEHPFYENDSEDRFDIWVEDTILDSEVLG